MLVLRGKENRRSLKKTRTKARTNNKRNPQTTPGWNQTGMTLVGGAFSALRWQNWQGSVLRWDKEISISWCWLLFFQNFYFFVGLLLYTLVHWLVWYMVLLTVHLYVCLFLCVHVCCFFVFLKNKSPKTTPEKSKTSQKTYNHVNV